MQKSYFLQAGPMTGITPQIQAIADRFPETFEDFVDDFKKWRSTRIGHTEFKTWEEKEKYFRKRTASEIVEQALENPDNHTGTTGCTDDALLFITMARAKGFPTKYVECVQKGDDGHNGHVFAKVFDDGEWRVVDPSSRAREKGLNIEDYNIIAEGLDYKELDLDSLEKIKERAKEFLKLAH